MGSGKTLTLGTGPWKGVRCTSEPYDEAPDRLMLAVNGYFPDPYVGSGFYARPGFARPTSVANGGNSGQQVYTHTALDGTHYIFLFVNGKVWRWNTDLSSAPVDVTPTNVTIATTKFVGVTSLADSIVVNDSANIPWIGTNLGSTPITATLIDYQTASVLLSRGTTPTQVANAAFTYLLSGVNYSKAATPAGTALPAGTIPINQWGVYRVSVNTAGTITVTAGAANYTTGYANEPAAIAALPATPAGQWNVGHFSLQTGVGFTFIAGTDALQGGVGGNPANVTNYYTGAAPPWQAYGAPVIYTGAVFFVLLTVEGVSKRSSIAWSEPNQPAIGYEQTSFDNRWDLTQTSQDPIYVLIATNDALYYFRAFSIGGIAGAPGINFQNTATHDLVAGNVGCTSWNSARRFLNYIYFPDAIGRTHRFAAGGAPEPLWMQTRGLDSSLFMGPTSSVTADAWAVIEPNLNLYITAAADQNQWQVFDAQTGIFMGTWLLASVVDIDAAGIAYGADGRPALTLLQKNASGTCFVHYLTQVDGLVWQDNGASVVVTAQSGWLGYDGKRTFRPGIQARAMLGFTQSETPYDVQIVMQGTGGVQTSVTRAPNGIAGGVASAPHLMTGRVVVAMDTPVSRGFQFFGVRPTTTDDSQWKLWRLEVDVTEGGDATVEDF